jgi:hypothetical protein
MMMRIRKKEEEMLNESINPFPRNFQRVELQLRTI